MNILKEAQSVLDFATYYPFLCKATADNDSITPGHTQEEIIKISFLSHQHRIHLLDFLLSKLSHLGWAGKQKVVRLLLRLCQKGHCEVRFLLRQKDGVLREAASHGGPPDPVLDSTPQLFFTSLIQELRSYIFDPALIKMDEGLMLKGESQPSLPGVVASGYGSSENKGKYEGFGSSPMHKEEGIVEQVLDMFGKVVNRDSCKQEQLEVLLKGDKGQYQPFSLPNITSDTSKSVLVGVGQAALSTSSSLCSSINTIHRNKPHIVGKVGGDWGSDDDDVTNTQTVTSFSYPSVLAHQGDEPVIGQDPEKFFTTLLLNHASWPLDVDDFASMCRDSTLSNSFQLLNELEQRMKFILARIEAQMAAESASRNDSQTLPRNVSPFGDVSTKVENLIDSRTDNLGYVDQHNLLVLLLFIEFALNEDLILVPHLQSQLDDILGHINDSKIPNEMIKAKAKKMRLIFKRLNG